FAGGHFCMNLVDFVFGFLGLLFCLFYARFRSAQLRLNIVVAYLHQELTALHQLAFSMVDAVDAPTNLWTDVALVALNPPTDSKVRQANVRSRPRVEKPCQCRNAAQDKDCNHNQRTVGLGMARAGSGLLR